MRYPHFSKNNTGVECCFYCDILYADRSKNDKEDKDMSLIDEDELVCKRCGHIGLWLNGDFDVECPECGAEYPLIDDEQEFPKR